MTTIQLIILVLQVFNIALVCYTIYLQLQVDKALKKALSPPLNQSGPQPNFGLKPPYDPNATNVTPNFDARRRPPM